MDNKMLKMAFASLVLGVSSFANAGLVLLADLSVENTITLTATSGTSLATVSGRDSEGFYLADFFDSALPLLYTLISGNLTSANNASNNTPLLFNHYRSRSKGLNVYSFTNDAKMLFTAGELAFSGQASWNVDAASYASALNGAQSGNVYAPADRDRDIANATLIGAWEVIGATDVPEPSTLAIFALGLMGLASRRFMKKS
ncbi:PEP-CTERM sorting domain-containing protein [uncultured Paraglaciecola sp.]|uniref:PEP-CTERM sorting domain-containing protein n=1 Tax=uncultured Paraglaciecola sp. TaxID=1765024 RepID=UPI0025D40965|nr:PEP-CTERM sorting domain-containing protein [uncultured Paraglaciecola sp.]